MLSSRDPLSRLSRANLFLAGFFFVWFIGVCTIYDCAHYTQALTQFFVYGRSFYKAKFFLVWTALLFLLASFPLFRLPKISAKWLIFSLGAMSILSFYSHALLVKYFGLQVSDYVLTVFNREISDASFSHIHSMKSVLTFLMNLVKNSEEAAYFDPGISHFKALPLPFVMASAVFWIATLALFILYPFGKEKRGEEQRLSPFWLICYAVASCTCVKLCLDGGPLSAEFPPYVAMLSAVIVWRAKGRFSKIVLIWLVVYAGVAASAYLLRSLLGSPDTDIRHHLMVAAFSLFLIFFFSGFEARKYLRMGISVIFLGAAIYASLTHFWQWFHNIGQVRIPAGTPVYRMDYYCDGSDPDIILRDGKFCVKSEIYKTDKTIYEIKKELGTPQNFSNVAYGEGACEGRELTLAAEIYLHQEKPEIKETASGEIFREIEMSPCGAGEGCTFRIRGRLKGCVSPTQYVPLINRIHELGYRFFVLVPKSDKYW